MMKRMHLLCPYILFSVLLLGLSPSARGQTKPDTTYLLRQAGVDPEALNNQKQKTVQPANRQPAPSSPVHTLPFASRGNSIELVVANTTAQPAEDLVIEAAGIPEWMQLRPSRFTIGSLKPGAETVAGFTFHVSEEAPVGQPVSVTFKAEDSRGMSWSREIVLQVGPPDRFKLFQNYPNPFGLSTTIRYRLPQEMKVTVRVYNVLGQQVATLSDEVQSPGSQTLQWDGARYASGVYFYRVIAEDGEGKKIMRNKKMLLVK